MRHAKAMFAEIHERLELARDTWTDAREEWHGHISAGTGGVARRRKRQAKEQDPDEVKERLARIVGRDLGPDGSDHEVGAVSIRDRLNQALGRGKPDPRQKDRHELDEERKRQRLIELGRQRERDRDLGWER